MAILMKAYRDVNGEIVYVEDGSFQDLDSIAGGLTAVPGLNFSISNDLLNNETLDAKLDDSQLVDDPTFASPTSDTVPSTSSVKTYVDNAIDGVNDASEINYDNSTSGLAATNVQDAIDEVEGRLDTAETNIATNASGIATNTGNIATNTFNIATNTSNITTNTGNIATNTSDITELQLNQQDLITLSGRPENSTDLGTFTGTTIPDGANNKVALQSLETALESISASIRVTDVFVVADIPARDALVGIDEGDVAKVIDASADPQVTSGSQSYIYDGTVWIRLNVDDQVFSVNGQVGAVVLTTTEISEGTNLYFTDTRARTAAVVNSLAGSQTDQAPSVAAVNAALQAQDEASEIAYDNSTSGLTATNVQDAIDENDARLDAIEAIAKEYIYANQTVAQTDINGTAENVVFDNEALQSTGSVFSLNTTTGEITVNKTGVFKIEYVVTADTADGARRTSETTLEIDTGSGFAAISASVGSATAYGYHRNNASGENSAYGQAILSLTSGNSLRLRIRRSNGAGEIDTIPQGTSISIEEK